METFTKDDLVYEYNWSLYENDDPKISGMPDSSTFNRTEGLQTLYIVNHPDQSFGMGCGQLWEKNRKNDP